MISLLRRPRSVTAPLETARLRLVAITAAHLNMEAHDVWQLRNALSADLTTDWPPEYWETPVRAHILAQLTTQPETVGWHRYVLLKGKRPLLVGCLGGFPCAAGDVELGYSVVNSHQRRGFATEAVEELIVWLLQQPAVHSVSAQAYEKTPASVKVMQRCGLRFVGAGDDPGTVRYRRWR